jgi:hypothetical protein
MPLLLVARYDGREREETHMHIEYVGLGLVGVLVVVVAISMLPDLVRYIKITRM